MLSARSFSRGARMPKHCHYCLCQASTTTTFTTLLTPTATTTTTTNVTLIPTRSAHHFRRKYVPKEKKYAIFKGFGPIPPYPYGPSQWFKQSNRALYGGSRVTFGNNVSGKFEIKTRRRWRLNSQRKRLYSKALDRMIRVRVTVKVLRTIDKVGGLDEYLLGHKPARIRGLGPRGWALRWRLMQEPSVKERIRRERREMGIVDAENDDDGEHDRAMKVLRTTPETLARKDYEKIVKDKSGNLLGTEPGRWRLLHVLYMRRLKEEKEIIAKLQGEGGAAGGAEGRVERGVESRAETTVGHGNHDGIDSSAVAKEVREIDAALDAEDGMTDEDVDKEETEHDEDDHDVDVVKEKAMEDEKKNMNMNKKQRQILSSRSETVSDAAAAAAGNGKDKGKGMEKKNMPWNQKQARRSKGPLQVHPELLEAAERGEQPRSSF